MKNKLIALAAAAAFGLGGAVAMTSAQAATPLSAAACASDSCAVTIQRAAQDNGINAGQPLIGTVHMASGTSMKVSVFVVTFAETDSVTQQGEITSVTKVSDDVVVDQMDGGTMVSIPTKADAPGGQVIIGPSDLTLANAKDGKIPMFAGQGSTKVSTAYMWSDRAADTGINIGADFYTTYDAVKSYDPSRADETGYNLFISNFEFGNDGDTYNVQLLRDGKWVNIGVTGKSSAGVDYDEARTAKGLLNSGSVSWKLPADITAGDYKVRLFNETQNVAGSVERNVHVEGAAGTATPTPTPSASPTATPTATGTNSPSATPTATNTNAPTGLPDTGN